MKFDIPILYENDDVVVINKPAGLIVHSDGRTKEPSVVDWVVKTYPEIVGVGEPWTSPQGEVIDRPGIVHRLDRTTSGVMVIAKTQDAYVFLKKQFQDRLVEKEYRVFVYGHHARDHGVIEMEIVRIRSTPPRWGVARAGEEKKHRAAVTEWKLIRRGIDSVTGEKVSLLEVSPKTGRTHQIRVHLAAIHHPVLCDPLYAPARLRVFGFLRPALHAKSLTLTLPSGEKKTFEAPFPEDFREAEKLLA